MTNTEFRELLKASDQNILRYYDPSGNPKGYLAIVTEDVIASIFEILDELNSGNHPTATYEAVKKQLRNYNVDRLYRQYRNTVIFKGIVWEEFWEEYGDIY